MSDLELTDPFDPEAYEQGARAPFPMPRPAPARGEGARPSPPPDAGAPEGEAGGGRVAWKAAASSIPRLRQKPASGTDPGAGDAFPGFAQDARPAPGSSSISERGGRGGGAVPGAGPESAAMPLAVEPPFWEIWLDRLGALPRGLVLGAGVALLLGVVAVLALLPRGEPRVSLARLRQQPEAFDGRLVRVQGRAGETFSIGGSYVFNLRQGRDTIVVYSRTRQPAVNEHVRAIGTVSIGYLDGVPRVAILESPPAH